MSLNPEWRDRLETWKKEIQNHFYRPLGAVQLSGFVTGEQLTPQEAAKRPFAPMSPGTKWGGKWEYAWLKARIVLPPEAQGQRIVAYLTDRESLTFVNGRVRTGQYKPTMLTRLGRAGEVFDVLVEAYAGHGPTPCHSGPMPPGRHSVPEPPAQQAQIIDASFGIWQEDVYQLYIDIETLIQARDRLPSASLRQAKIDQALKDFTLTADFELPGEQMLASCRLARRRLTKAMKCRNGSTAPVLYGFGHAHLDTAWLWPLAHTERKIARTVANQLELMEEYPRHRFLLSQPEQYVMLERCYPELHGRLVKAIKAGKVIAEGGMWVEADTNLLCGESLIRQIIHGKRFFSEQFGIDSQLLWLPDVFGYSGALPQILAGCGIKYFSTQKIFWRYHGGQPFPFNHFMWQGIDGTEILTFLHSDYNSHTNPANVLRRWEERAQIDDIETFLFPFGFGDGGGGPGRDHLEYAGRLADFEGVPKVRITGPNEFFRDLEKRPTANRYVGELYFQNHRGTYTSQARTKRLNRKVEFALREAEMWGAAAGGSGGDYRYPLDQADRTWKRVLLNQFHDIIPGSSIHRVYEEAEASYGQALGEATALADSARAALVRPSADKLAFFNSLSWQRTELVELPVGLDSPCDSAGRLLEVQEVDGRRFAEVTVPPCGWTTIASGKCEPVRAVRRGVKAAARLLENDLIRVKLNASGEITSIFDKSAGQELAGGVCNRLAMFKDVPSQFDAWDIDSMYELTPLPLKGEAKIEVISAGPLVGVLRVTRQVNNSLLTQDISLRRGSRRIDFATRVDWQESHKMLKVGFTVDVHADEAIHEVQFGHIRRPNHRSNQFDADRFEVAQQKWSALAEETRGCAILNDCKYGLNVLGRSINLTLLRSPMAPDETADRGQQEFTYSFYAWNGSLAQSGVVQAAYELNCPLTAASGDAGERSVFAVDAPNVVIETVKPAEDGSQDVIVRLYESMRSTTRCRLTSSLPFAQAAAADMLEKPLRKLRTKDGAIELELRPFEIKTVRLTAQSRPQRAKAARR